MTDRPEIFFVLNNLVNGQHGVSFDTQNYEHEHDGWYVKNGHSATRMGPYKDSKTASWVASQLEPYSDTSNIGSLIQEHVDRMRIGERPTLEEVYLSILVELVEVDNVLKRKDIVHLLEHWDYRRAEEPSEYI